MINFRETTVNRTKRSYKFNFVSRKNRIGFNYMLNVCITFNKTVHNYCMQY